MPRKKSTSRPRVTRVSIRVERRDEPDWDRYAWALLQYVKLISQDKPAQDRAPREQEP